MEEEKKDVFNKVSMKMDTCGEQDAIDGTLTRTWVGSDVAECQFVCSYYQSLWVLCLISNLSYFDYPKMKNTPCNGNTREIGTALLRLYIVFCYNLRTCCP